MARAAIVAVVASLAGCASLPPEPIVVADGAVTVRNQTPRTWTRIRVVVNAYYSADAREIGPGGEARAPLGDFRAALGQRLDAQVRVFSVDVRGIDDRGDPVRLTWPSDRQ